MKREPKRHVRMAPTIFSLLHFYRPSIFTATFRKADEDLLTRERISKLLGTSELGEVLAARVIGSIPLCPFVVYPVIKGFSLPGFPRS